MPRLYCAPLCNAGNGNIIAPVTIISSKASIVNDEGDDNELYTVNVIMDDPSQLESIYGLKKDPSGLYDQDLNISSLNPDIGFLITSFLGKDLNDPAPYKITFSYHGQNDELYDILPRISV